MEMMLWIIALLFSTILVILSILSLLGGAFDFFDDGYDGGDIDGGDVSFQFFSIRNLVVFFTIFGWSGLATKQAGGSDIAAIAVGLLSGVTMVAILYLLLKNVYKLRQSGTLQVENAINQVGEVYLRIPSQRGGRGKVHVVVQGRLVEIEAVTDDETDIATGKTVQVVNKLNSNVLVVTSKTNSLQ
ncbi:hypothetical protein [Aridibaculum aurantiacum]|uniref:hypothetical protein n=1 Tax=Aridibaculum aurantiacum TaxID=2810307 RepID=UPI001A979402|nr:hypothetical protein [Aridibaculum aurantiacum]